MVGLETLTITVLGEPVSAPRMTRRDKWQKRPCVVRYRQWRDLLRKCVLEQVGDLPPPDRIVELSWVAYFTPPASWNELEREGVIGRLHRSKPDRDNLDKAVLDALFERDEGIALGTIAKRWAWESRLEIKVTYLSVPEAEDAVLRGRRAA